MRAMRLRRSFGKVYQGWWRGGMVAIKVVPHDGDLGEKVEIVRESLLSSAIQHPQIVRSSGRPLLHCTSGWDPVSSKCRASLSACMSMSVNMYSSPL